MDRSLFFLVLSFICIWLVIDQAIGNKYISTMLVNLFPWMGQGEITPANTDDYSTQKRAGSYAAISQSGTSDLEREFVDDPAWSYYKNNTPPYAPGMQMKLDDLKKRIADFEKKKSEQSTTKNKNTKKRSVYGD